MDRRSKFIFQVIVGVVIIGAAIFFGFRYLMKGSPVIRVLALGFIIIVCYLVVDFIKRKSKYK